MIALGVRFLRESSPAQDSAGGVDIVVGRESAIRDALKP